MGIFSPSPEYVKRQNRFNPPSSKVLGLLEEGKGISTAAIRAADHRASIPPFCRTCNLASSETVLICCLENKETKQQQELRV